MKASLTILATIVSTLTVHPMLHAAVQLPVVITSGGVTTVASGGKAPGSSADYDFFGGGTQPVELTNFTLTTPPGFQYNAAAFGITYSSLQPPAGGTVFSTGIGQPASGASTTPFTANLATFTLDAGEGMNRSFSVYVLFGNTDGINVFDASIGLSVDGGTVFTVPVIDTTETNDFLKFNVSGLNAGDTLTVSATDTAVDAHGSTSNKPYIGGVTFAVPEPSSWAAMSLGAGLLGLTLRHRAHRA